MLQILLVSQSPRRRKILQQAGFIFQTDTVEVSEIIDKNLNVDQAIGALAELKLKTYLSNHNLLKLKDFLVVTADTMVVLEGQALGKPKNSQEAKSFLRRLSKKTHSVKTGICLFHGPSQKKQILLETTFVTFKALSGTDIEDYVQSGESLDKAGGYGIQGRARHFVQKMEGSWNNVVGFPLERFEECIQEKKWDVHRTKS